MVRRTRGRVLLFCTVAPWRSAELGCSQLCSVTLALEIRVQENEPLAVHLVLAKKTQQPQNLCRVKCSISFKGEYCMDYIKIART